MDPGADGRPSYAVSIDGGDGGGSAWVRKRGLDPRSSELLRHERQVLGQLSHPNVIELVARRDADHDAEVVTYLAGRSTLADRPPVDALAAARLAAHLATTLADLHQLG